MKENMLNVQFDKYVEDVRSQVQEHFGNYEIIARKLDCNNGIKRTVITCKFSIKNLIDKVDDALVEGKITVEKADELKRELSKSDKVYITLNSFIDRIYGLNLSSFYAVVSVINDIDNYDVEEEIRYRNAIEKIDDFKYMKKYVYLNLINTKRNKELLKNVPYIQFYDMSITFRLLFSNTDPESKVIVTNEMLEKWNISLHELFGAAYNNTLLISKPVIFSMDSLVKEMEAEESLFEAWSEEEKEVIKKANNQMLIGTFEELKDGAVLILYKDVLKKMAKQLECKSLFVFPSSTSEIIVVNDLLYQENCGETKEQVEEAAMKKVYEVNRSKVYPEEFLSDSVFRFDAVKGTISKINGGDETE